MRLAWLDELRQHPIDWSIWSGYQNSKGCPWVTDGKIAVRRSASDSKRIARVETERHAPYRDAPEKAVERAIGAPPDERIEATWLGVWGGDDGDRYVSLGHPELATYFVDRLRIAYLLCGFDSAFWANGRRARDGHPYPLQLVRDGETVGFLMPIDTDNDDVHVPDEIRDHYEQTVAT